MKNLIKIMTSLAISFCLIATISVVAFAEDVAERELDINTKGSIIIDYCYNDTPLNDIEFRVYQITSLDEDANHVLNSKYSEVELDYDLMYESEYWLAFRDNLQNYINYEMIEPEFVFYTDNAGAYHLEDLELGVYYIEAETSVENELTIFSEPILITVGSYEESNELWVYHYTVQPKVAVLDDETYNITVEKIWENTNSELLIPEEITVELNRNGELFDVVVLNEENKWSYTWFDVDPCDCWAIKELDKLDDFVVNYEKDILSFTITNTYIGEEDEELPQTGTFAYLVPLMSSLGLVLVLLGVLLKYKFRYKEND
ncbi:MAG: Cna B-type domain-containing protein [Clostridia bacterium]